MRFYSKVKITDWVGQENVFEILSLEERENVKYSCVFRNSIGDYEKVLVDKEDLRQ